METVSKSESAKLRELLMELCFTPNSKLKPEHVKSHGLLIPQVGQSYAHLAVWESPRDGKFHCYYVVRELNSIVTTASSGGKAVIEDTLEMAVYNAMELYDLTHLEFYSKTGFQWVAKFVQARRRDAENHMVFVPEPDICAYCYDPVMAMKYRRERGIKFNGDAPVAFGE